MGTLRLSVQRNQMSWMQFSARGGGACSCRRSATELWHSLTLGIGAAEVMFATSIAAKAWAFGFTTAFTREESNCFEGAQHGISAQQAAHGVPFHSAIPLWQGAGIASSGCEAVAMVSSRSVTSAPFITT